MYYKKVVYYINTGGIMKFEKEKKEKAVIYSVRLKESVRKDIQKIADREKVTPSVIIRKAIEMILEQDRKDMENE
jgi:predicted DNA-binding protein